MYFYQMLMRKRLAREHLAQLSINSLAAQGDRKQRSEMVKKLEREAR